MRPILAIALLLAACGPKKQTAIEDIPKMKDLGDVMGVQAKAMDPLFKKASQTAFTDDEWAKIADAAARLSATTAKVKESFSKGEEFVALDMQLADQARKLGDAAQSKNVADTAKLIGDIKDTCKACHKKFR
jgi:cytochrome c556